MTDLSKRLAVSLETASLSVKEWDSIDWLSGALSRSNSGCHSCRGLMRIRPVAARRALNVGCGLSLGTAVVLELFGMYCGMPRPQAGCKTTAIAH